MGANRPTSPIRRTLVGWLMRPEAALTEDERSGLKQVLDDCPDLTRLREHVAAFADLLTHRPSVPRRRSGSGSPRAGGPGRYGVRWRTPRTDESATQRSRRAENRLPGSTPPGHPQERTPPIVAGSCGQNQDGCASFEGDVPVSGSRTASPQANDVRFFLRRYAPNQDSSGVDNYHRYRDGVALMARRGWNLIALSRPLSRTEWSNPKARQSPSTRRRGSGVRRGYGGTGLSPPPRVPDVAVLRQRPFLCVGLIAGADL